MTKLSQKSKKLGARVITPKTSKRVKITRKKGKIIPGVARNKVKKLIVKTSNSKSLSSEEATELIENQTVKFKSSPKKFKRLFFDIETSPNVVYSWRIGYNLIVNHDSIIQERAIICVCYKWSGSSKVHSLNWKDGDDKQLLVDFIKVMNEADEIVGHNSDKFDIKWLRTRCFYHGLPMFPDYNSVDTLKMARKHFNFNSNKLDYIGQFAGVGKKMDTGGFGLWKAIIEDKNPKAMEKMVKYCKVDVIRLGQIYDKMIPYGTDKVHVGAVLGKGRCSCPRCGSERTSNRGFRYLSSGLRKSVLQCFDCERKFSLPESATKQK